MKNPLNSITFRIALSFAVLSVLIILASLRIFEVTGIKDMKERIKSDHIALAQSLANSIGKIISTSKMNLEDIAREPYMKSMDPEQQGILLLKVQNSEKLKQFGGIEIHDVSGTKMLSRSKAGLKNVDKESPIDVSVLEVIRNKEPYISDTFFATTEDSTTKAVMAISVPIENVQQNVIGVLSGLLLFDEQGIMRDANSIYIGSDGYIYIIDDKGKLIFHPDTSKINKVVANEDFYTNENKSKKETFGQVLSRHSMLSGIVVENKKDMLHSLAPISDTNWFVGVARPMKEAFAPIPKMQRKLLFFSLIVLAVALSIAFYLSFKITDPISKLLEGVRKISNGNLTQTQTIPVKSEDEIGELTKAFNEMSRSLAKNKKLLDDRIKELSSLNKVASSLVSSINEEDIINSVCESFKNLTNNTIPSLLILFGNNPPHLYYVPDSKYHISGMALNSIKEILFDKITELGGKILNDEVIFKCIGKDSEEIDPNKEIIDSVKCSVMTPIKVADKIEGIFGLIEIEPMKADENTKKLFSTLSNEASIAITNARMYGKVNQLYSELQQKYKELEKSNAELEEANNRIRETYQQLVRAEKLSILGQLASSVAHDINNPLGTISLHTYLMKNKIPEGDSMMEHLQIIQGETDRIANLVKSLLNFSRKQSSELKPVELNSVINEVLVLMEHQLRRAKVKITKDFATSLPKVPADRSKLQQVFINLITNAIQAMPKGGELTISTKLEETIPDEKPNVRITFTDTGVGIPPDILPKLFTPFYTTKKENEGTGLGLSICKTIIEEDHQGKIEVTSEVGKGSSFIIKLKTES